MCLFTSDVYSQCKHVECNLIRAIQLQNTAIFPQAQSPNNESQSEVLNGNRNHTHSSKSPQQHHSQMNHEPHEEKQLISNPFPVKEESPSNPMMTQKYRPINHNCDGTMTNEKVLNEPSPSQSITLQNQSSFKVNQNRVQALEMQVSLLKNGMQCLLKSLKDKNVISQREHQAQMAFLEKFESYN